ncbi:hypothetical protein CY35_15G048500 [Sphagnum magellanicum]|jgi:hypothetical protein|nr:hypothetical protein CY35_15G048500 [Sphagnum magellanicum]
MLTRCFLESLQKVVKKKEETNGKGDMPPSGLMKHPQKDFHLDCKKEYQHSRYMDFPPPLRPPCGWDSCIDRGFPEDKPFSDCVFEGLSLYSSWRMCFCHLTNLPVTASVLCSILTPGRSKSRTWQKSSSITQASESDLISKDLPSLQTNEKAFHTIIDNL